MSRKQYTIRYVSNAVLPRKLELKYESFLRQIRIGKALNPDAKIQGILGESEYAEYLLVRAEIADIRNQGKRIAEKTGKAFNPVNHWRFQREKLDKKLESPYAGNVTNERNKRMVASMKAAPKTSTVWHKPKPAKLFTWFSWEYDYINTPHDKRIVANGKQQTRNMLASLKSTMPLAEFMVLENRVKRFEGKAYTSLPQYLRAQETMRKAIHFEQLAYECRPKVKRQYVRKGKDVSCQHVTLIDNETGKTLVNKPYKMSHKRDSGNRELTGQISGQALRTLAKKWGICKAKTRPVIVGTFHSADKRYTLKVEAAQ